MPDGGKSLEIRRKTIGPDHPQIAFSHELIGELHEAQGNRDAAFASYQEALRVREKALGADNPRTGDVLLSIGLLKLRGGKLVESRKLPGTRAADLREVARSDAFKNGRRQKEPRAGERDAQLSP